MLVASDVLVTLFVTLNLFQFPSIHSFLNTARQYVSASHCGLLPLYHLVKIILGQKNHQSAKSQSRLKLEGLNLGKSTYCFCAGCTTTLDFCRKHYISIAVKCCLIEKSSMNRRHESGITAKILLAQGTKWAEKNKQKNYIGVIRASNRRTVNREAQTWDQSMVRPINGCPCVKTMDSSTAY